MATEQQLPKLVGSLVEHQAHFTPLPTEDTQWAIQNPKVAIALCVEAIRNRAKDVATKGESFLRLISGSKSITIDATDGTETLAEAGDVFASIDSDFEDWDLNYRSPATKKTPVAVYELIRDATLAQMFNSLNIDTRKLCLTQAQIKGFVRKHFTWLRSKGGATLFLFESDGEFFVAFVDFNVLGSLGASVRQFENNNVGGAEFRPRVVVPQLVKPVHA